MALTKVKSGMRTLGTGEVATANMAVDPTDASNLSSGAVPVGQLTTIPGANVTGSVPLAALGNVDTTAIVANQDDIALLGFKVAANGSLARYNLVDQSIDAFEDASGVDASASTNELRNAANYYSGGTEVAAGYTSFTTPGTVTWTGPTGLTNLTSVLVVGGGGGGGAGTIHSAGGGGGGAGGYRTATTVSVTPGTDYTVTVGAGGDGGQTNTKGSDSVFSAASLTSTGGGRGGQNSRGSGQPGGSGGGGNAGGAASATGAGSGNTPSTSPSQGNNGGSGSGAAYTGAAGGGAASGSGSSSSNGAVHGRSGGNGTANSITGSSVTYAGGGGGGGDTGTGGSGGSGGGGAGGNNNQVGNDGTDGLGGGGGGGSVTNSKDGGAGGDGIVIIAYDAYSSIDDLTLVSNAQTAQSPPPTTGDLVMTISNGAGTTTENVDIKAYISRDGSAYTSAVNLVSQGTTGGHTILTANGVDLSGITSGTSMRWKITTHNQSASKTTRIQAVSLGWS